MRIGLDIGGHFIKAGLIDKGSVKRFTEFPAGTGREGFLASINLAIEDVLEPGLEGIGVGCPGPADYKKGIILDTPNIPIPGFNLRQYLQKKFNLPLAFTNDAIAFSVGEALYGAGRGKNLILGITLGTGLGGGIILNGKPMVGKGNAGHFSSLILCNQPSKDHYFKYFSFEVLCSERGLLARAPKFNSAKAVAEAAITGNRQARAAFDEYGHDLGLGIGSLIAAFDPDVVVVGGGISRAWPLFEKTMNQAVAEVTHISAKVVKQQNPHSAVLGAAEIL